MAHKLGMDCKLYRNTGTYGSPTWNEVTNIKDATLNFEMSTTDVSTRGNNGWRAEVATLRTATIEFSMIYDPAQDDFTAFQAAFFANTSIELLALDGPVATSGSQGLRATMMLATFSEPQNLEEAVIVNITAKVTYSANAPTWFTAP